jgi:O-antigen/teichoic acid export membrane protein
MIAPMGLEKYSLRKLPVLLMRGDMEVVRSFLKASTRQLLISSVIVAGLIALAATFLVDLSSSTYHAVLVSCLSLPGGVLAHYAIEVLSAQGRVTRASLVLRIAVPVCVTAIVICVLVASIKLTGALATAFWGISWVFALSVLLIFVKTELPLGYWKVSTGKNEISKWRAEAKPFWFYRIALAAQAQSAIIALDLLQSSPAAVGAYAAATVTAGLIVALATSTNRFYSHKVSILLEKRDFDALMRLRWERQMWLVPTMVMFMTLVLFFGRSVLEFFRPEFVNEGLSALWVLSGTACVSVLFALSPTYLKYAGHNRTIYTILVSASVVQLILLALLVPQYSAFGAAISNAASLIFMYLAFAWFARKELTRLKAD